VPESSKTDLQFLDQFEPDLFWKTHGRKIIIGLVAVLVVGLVFILQQREAEQTEIDTARQLSQTADPGTLQRIADQYRGKPLGAQALLRLADVHYQAGRMAEAATAYQEFLNRHPRHSLTDTARLGLAAATEAQGNFEAARDQYTTLASRPDGYAAIAGKVGLARCLEALGDLKQARQLYEELMPSVLGSPWESEVSIRWAVLSRHPQARPASPAEEPPAIPLQQNP
jgi:tetratricopeptide (TPR) repeat protein